jgi:hypothetical protein
VHHRTIHINHQPDATFFSLLSWRLFTAQHVPGVFPPIIRSSMAAMAASGFTFVSWWQSCCVRGRAGRPARPLTLTLTLTIPPHPLLVPWSRKGRLFLSFSDFLSSSDFVFLRLSVFLRLLRLSQTLSFSDFLSFSDYSFYCLSQTILSSILSVFLRLFFLLFFLSFSDYSFFYSFCLSQIFSDYSFYCLSQTILSSILSVFLRLFFLLFFLSQTILSSILSVFLRLFFLLFFLSFSDYSFFYYFCLSQTILSSILSVFLRLFFLFPLWAVWPVQSLSARTRVHFTYLFVFLSCYGAHIGRCLPKFRDSQSVPSSLTTDVGTDNVPTYR